MTDKEYIKGLLEEINICNQIISKYEELTNGYKHEIKILNNKYRKAFKRLKSKQREIDRLKEENERFENNMKSVLEIEKKQAVKEFAEILKRKFHNYYPSIDQYCCSVKAVNANDIDELLKEYDKWKSIRDWQKEMVKK